jgi:hypothetical protein
MAGTNPGNFSVRGVHINQALSTLSIGYHPSGMVAEQVFTPIAVNHESDDYWFWDKGQAFRVARSDGYGTVRADKSRAVAVNFGASVKSYTAFEFAAETDISDRERDNADAALQLEVSKVRRAQDLVLLEQEIRVAALLTNTATYAAANTTTLSGTSQWNNASFASQSSGTQSIIESNIDTGREAIRIATGGLEPNAIIVPRAVARVMKRDVGVRDQIKYTDPNILVGGHLPPQLWGLNVIMPGAVYTTSAEGESVTMTDVWGKSVVIAYVNPNPGLDALTLGAIFRVKPWQVKQWRDEAIDTTYYRPHMIQTEQVVAADCGYLIKNAIA